MAHKWQEHFGGKPPRQFGCKSLVGHANIGNKMGTMYPSIFLYTHEDIYSAPSEPRTPLTPMSSMCLMSVSPIWQKSGFSQEIGDLEKPSGFLIPGSTGSEKGPRYF